jgi:hypothetical protein
MTPTELVPADTPGVESLPLFDGFPYLNTRLVPALYHVALLPADAPESTLLRLARVQARANRLDTCLVLDARRAIYLWPDGRAERSTAVPRGGTLVTSGLALPQDLLDTSELGARQQRLDLIVAAGRRGTYLFGNLAKGGHTATPEELRRLEGTQPVGTPRGLQRCEQCLDWRGECLDSNPEFAGMVMPVHCRCDNHNRCARCGAPLYDRRLNANFYDPRDGGIWHVPGFCALGHRCADRRAARTGSDLDS